MNLDAWKPAEIAARVQAGGVAKVRGNALTLLVLAVLAGAFISLGGIFYLVIVTDSQLGLGITRFLGGLGFSLGLILVVVAGAELFTGNNLVAMAWASRLVSLPELLKNWVLVYVGNVIGALGTAVLVWLGGVDQLGAGAVGAKALSIAEAKASLGFVQAFALGILCNALVCLAVWLANGGRSIIDKVAAIVLPIAAFVAIGAEHSIANWFFLPYAYLLGASESAGFVEGSLQNLGVVTLGNIAGGTLLVAGVYWLAYLREGSDLGPAEE